MTTLIFPKNQRQCTSFSINMTILFLSFKRATTVPKKLIYSQHHKRLRRKSLTAFHSLTHLTLTTTQLNLSFFKTLVKQENDYLRDVERNVKDASKPGGRQYNLPSYSKQHKADCGLSLHLGSSESRKTLEQKYTFQIGTLNPHGTNERFSFN